MALITQFAQPGMYVAQGLAGMRENRLAMAAAEAERATERAQQDAIRNILGAGATQTGGEQFTRGGAAGVGGVTGGAAGEPIAPSQPQAPRLPYSDQQIQAMTLVDRPRASEMRQQNTAAATEVNRRETRLMEDADRIAERVANSPNPDDLRPASARAFAEQHNIPISQAEEIIRRREQMVSPPRPTELERIIQGAGVEQGSAQERQIYQGILQRRLEGSGMRELAQGLALMARGQEAIGAALGEQGFRTVVLDQLQGTQDEAANAASLLSLTEQFRSTIDAAGGTNVAGAIGQLRRAGTGLTGTLRQLSGMGEAGQGIAEFVNQTVSDARGGLDDSTFEQLFGNPNIAAVEILGNAVNYANARMRHGPGVLSNQDVNRNSVVTGVLQSDEMLLSSLQTIETEAYERFQRAVGRNAAIQENPQLALGVPPLPAGIESRLSGQGRAAPAQSTTPADEEESIEALLRRYGG